MKKVNGSNKYSEYSLKSLGAKVAPTRKYVEWIDAIAKLQQDLKGGEDLIETLKIDVLTDRIFVMTPKGEVKDLPLGATPVDFAYSVHTDMGNRCQHAKVNGSVVSLDYKLKNGSVVEIMMGTKPEPKSAWLSFVKTANAKAKIRSYLRSLDKDKSFRDGKKILNEYLAKNNKPLLDDDMSILRDYCGKRLSVKDRISLVEEVGNGAVMGYTVLKKIFGNQFSGRPRKARTVSKKNIKFSLPRKKGISSDDIFIAGEAGLPYKLANCCKPKVGLPIVGYITRGQNVTIHMQKCKLLINADSDRIVEATWGNEEQKTKYPVKIDLLSKNRVGLIRDIAEVITSMNVNILFFSDLEKSGDTIERNIILEVIDNEQLQTIMERLQRIRNVMDVKRSK
jgi:GTP pyrophosphokinase